MLPLYLCLSFIVTSVVTHDVTKEAGPIKVKVQEHKLNENRRFDQDLEDDEWHIAHVKDMLMRRSGCAGETYEDRVEKYRRTLLNDGGRVEYVSADALPVNVTELNQNITCSAKNLTDVFIKPNSWINIKKNLTVKERASLNDSNVERRANEDYEFSHEEYYDDETEFDHRNCPKGVMEVYELEVDHLKPYDIECELSLEWRSLDTPMT